MGQRVNSQLVNFLRHVGIPPFIFTTLALYGLTYDIRFNLGTQPRVT